MLENATKYQHFISQAEQRLNATNPDADDRNQRIYSFKIANRENYALLLERSKGNLISNNLSGLDLFSFDVPGGDKLRHNFEALFWAYEGSVATHTNNLLSKLNANSNDIKTEIIEIFAAKLMNFIRNPFCVQKTLNTFPDLASYDPTDHELLAIYQRIINGKKPHQAYQCAEFGINNVQYLKWLRVIFLLLAPLVKGQQNLFEQVIKLMFEDRENHLAVLVCEYDNHRCLLSDRGYTQPIPDGSHMAFSFNLCRKCLHNVHIRESSRASRG